MKKHDFCLHLVTKLDSILIVEIEKTELISSWVINELQREKNGLITEKNGEKENLLDALFVYFRNVFKTLNTHNFKLSANWNVVKTW